MSSFGKVAVLLGGARWRAEQGPRVRGCDPVSVQGRPSERVCEAAEHE